MLDGFDARIDSTHDVTVNKFSPTLGQFWIV